MPSGKTHNTLNSLLLLFFSVMSIYLWHDNKIINDAVFLFAGYIIGTFYLSPDLDLKNTKSHNNYGGLKLVWIPYINFMSHRGRSFWNPKKWSHKTILGSFSRVLYLFILLMIPVLTLSILTKDYSFIKVMISLIVSAKIQLIELFIGIEISAQLHYKLDFGGKN